MSGRGPPRGRGGFRGSRGRGRNQPARTRGGGGGGGNNYRGGDVRGPGGGGGGGGGQTAAAPKPGPAPGTAAPPPAAKEAPVVSSIAEGTSPADVLLILERGGASELDNVVAYLQGAMKTVGDLKEVCSKLLEKSMADYQFRPLGAKLCLVLGPLHLESAPLDGHAKRPAFFRQFLTTLQLAYQATTPVSLALLSFMALLVDPSAKTFAPLHQRIVPAIPLDTIGQWSYRDRTDFVDIFVHAGRHLDAQEELRKSIDRVFDRIKECVISGLHSEELRANCLFLLTLRDNQWTPNQ